MSGPVAAPEPTFDESDSDSEAEESGGRVRNDGTLLASDPPKPLWVGGTKHRYCSLENIEHYKVVNPTGFESTALRIHQPYYYVNIFWKKSKIYIEIIENVGFVLK